MNGKRWFEWLRWGMLMIVIAWTAFGVAQEAANSAALASAASPLESGSQPNPQSPAQPLSNSLNNSLNDSVRELQEQVRQLQAAVAGMRSDWQQARAETAELRRELGQVRAGSERRQPVLSDAVERSSSSNDVRPNPLPFNAPQDEQSDAQKEDRKSYEHTATLEEEYQLLTGKVDDQYQTKVESAAKYRLRVSGIVLMNLFSNQGVVDNVDLPMIAYARPVGNSGGSFGVTLRQSEIGFETFGPTIAGAKTRADLQLDLAGGFPSTPNGINSGLLRLRTGTMRLDWRNTSVVAGQDAAFFSPNSPTSFASLAIPSLSATGNLWAWIPQIRVEHRVVLGEDSSLSFQGGILDPVTGEAPSGSYYLQPGPGEGSRQPAYATHIAWTHGIAGQPLRVGAGGYYGRQDYGFNRNVDGWAGMTDLELPLSHQFSLTGEFYRGKALGGLYGGIGRSVLFSGDPTLARTEVQGLNSMGGWAQLKFRPANKWEFNAAFGMDNPYAKDLKYFRYSQAYGDPELARNQGSFVNLIYRPRSDLLFSAEYRHLTTYSLTEGGNSAGHLNLMMGVLF